MRLEFGVTGPETGGLVAAENRIGITMGKTPSKRFRVYFGPEDWQRIENLADYYEFPSRTGLMRVMCERCMALIPDTENISAKHRKLFASAFEVVSQEPIDYTKSFGPEIGTVYHSYIHKMAAALEFPSTAVFLRCLLYLIQGGKL